jgi:ATP-binding cassette subfamily B protein IrtA
VRKGTLLVIAHRLGSIVGADNIVVLDAGRIAEQGRHDELLERSGRYARMWAAYTAVQAKEWEVVAQ